MTRVGAIRLVAALLAGIVLAGALAACGDKKKKTSTSTTTTKLTATQKRQAAQRKTVLAAEKARREEAPQGSLEPAPETTDGVTAQSVLQNLPKFFSTQSPWNTQVGQLPTDPLSDRRLLLARTRTGVVEVAGRAGVRTVPRVTNEGLFINTTRWTTPIVTDENGVATKVFCRQDDCGPDSKGLTSLQIPADANPDPRYDGWFTVIDRGKSRAYDFWRARRQADKAISFQFVRIWDLTGPGYLAPNTVSARGSGLPLFAGVLTAPELRAGVVDHALAISLPGPAQGIYVQPASATDGNGNAASLPEGARLRLRPDVKIRARRGTSATRRRATEAILLALKRYGAIVVDRAVVPTLYAQKDLSAKLLDGSELQGLHVSDFEVLALGRRYRYPALSKTQQSGPGTSAAKTFAPEGAAGGGA